jgi:hypothetical protein
MRGGAPFRRKGRKAFFFEKKKQKTLTTLSRTHRIGTAKLQKFLVLFFRKEPFPLAALL